MRVFLFHLILFLISWNARSNEDKIEASSPSGHIQFSFRLSDNKATYSVKANNSILVEEGQLGLRFADFDLNEFTSFTSSTELIRELWAPVWGEEDSIVNQCNELSIALSANNGTSLTIVFRLFDEGFAFRYEVPKRKSPLILIDEQSSFKLSGTYNCWWSWADYNTLEKQYFHTSLDSVSHVSCPFTLQRSDGLYLAIHEADINDYSTMTLKKNGQNSFKVDLVPWADGALVKSQKALTSPWRVFMIGSDPGSLITNRMVLNLNEPNRIKDVSWIEPMSYCGVWWEMHLGISTWASGSHHGANTENVKRYIDFASANGIKGVLIEGWNTGWEDWGKKGAFDFATPYSDLDLKKIVQYAKDREVEIIGHHETGGDTESYEKRVKRAFRYYRRLGIRVVKTGYAGPVTPEGELHHGQCMVRHYNYIMKLAARNNIMLDVHEPIVLSGMSRTYPNLMTAEGVRGMEWNAWSDGNHPSHTCTLPFTRGLAGPTDYTPGIFDIDLSKHSKERIKWNSLDQGNSSVKSTIANQMALLIVLYSPLQMLADLPENYSDPKVLEVLRDLPTSWNETRVLAAEIGKYVIIARRSGNSWYVAGITNEEPRDIVINCDFLGNNLTYTGKSIQDLETSHYLKEPETYKVDSLLLKVDDTLKLHMAEGGGFLIRLQSQD